MHSVTLQHTANDKNAKNSLAASKDASAKKVFTQCNLRPDRLQTCRQSDGLLDLLSNSHIHRASINDVNAFGHHWAKRYWIHPTMRALLASAMLSIAIQAFGKIMALKQPPQNYLGVVFDKV
ncbi:hypothetical protein T11_8723 [Trichinella zimbabwensis]|uniref:Uncharacterized protein n=1 Tax=Trichinella zimbabwensis TaxID=268475 RepID=A0A0V1HD41_9BILA|nr:hypothetical protein T11_8723 [Trichinella zimbabwensis]